VRELIKRYVRNCDICKGTKAVRHALYGPLQPTKVPDRPWKSISMDFITDLPKSETYHAIQVVIDRLTKLSPLSQGHECEAVCKNIHKRNISATWATKRYHPSSRNYIYIRHIEGNDKITRNRELIEHGIPPANRRTNRTSECNTRTIPSSIYELSTR